MPLSPREALGAYQLVALRFTMESALSAGGLLSSDVDATITSVPTVEMPWGGFVAGISVDGVGGNFGGATFLVQVAGSAVAASSFAVDGVAVLAQTYDSGDVPFSASDSLAVELDAITTGRDATVTLWVAVNLT